MCTALVLESKDNEQLFGRNMDLAYNFNQSVKIIPRNFKYKNNADGKEVLTKYGIVGMMTVFFGHPSLADGMNEEGLGCAGLNFPGFCHLEEELKEGYNNIPLHDLMLWILGNFKSLSELRPELEKLNIVNRPISKEVPEPTLHFIVTDKTGESIVIEQTRDGLNIMDNPVGVLTNSPDFKWHLTNMRQYLGLKTFAEEDTKFVNQELSPLGVGTGIVGIPGDFTPPSRFVRTVFFKDALLRNEKDKIGVSEFFHVLNTVSMPRGSVMTKDNISDITQYTSCMNLEKGIYYYNTYNNNRINAVTLKEEYLDSEEIKSFPYLDALSINYQN